jgi:BspA type Leucine rich repeat region (6 copies)
VFEIQDNTFLRCRRLTRVKGVSIGRIAAIGDRAFASCTSLTNLPLGPYVQYVGSEAFADCPQLGSLTLPERVNYLGARAFAGCTGLTGIVIPNGVTTIGDRAFAGCSSLTNLTIPNHVVTIGNAVFEGCASLKGITGFSPYYQTSAGVLFDTDQHTLVAWPGGRTGNFISPPFISAARIGPFAFSLCTGLTNISIPNGVTNIGDYAFNGCSGLISISMPNYITHLGEGAFNGCSNLASISLPGRLTNLPSGVFSQCPALRSVTVPKSVTTLADFAFPGCVGLKAIFFQGAPPLIGAQTFSAEVQPVIYYHPGTPGWGPTFAGRPTLAWDPEILPADGTFGVKAGQFGFRVNGTSGLSFVLEATSDFGYYQFWTPVVTNTLVNGTAYFNDPQWVNYPARYYRLQMP